MREKMDFLRYAMEDLHWWQLWFCQIGLFCAGLAFRTNSDDALGLSATQTFVIILAGAALNKTLYFNQQFEFNTTTKTLLGGLLLITCMLIPRYLYLRDKFPWYSPVMLEIIVAHLMMFVQLGIEALTFKERMNKWKYDIMFQ